MTGFKTKGEDYAFNRDLCHRDFLNRCRPTNRVRKTDLHAATISRGFGERSVQRLQKDPKRVMERGGGIYFSW
jgi:hypothetical protein